VPDLFKHHNKFGFSVIWVVNDYSREWLGFAIWVRVNV
jgi:hypothetical protein